MTTRHMTYIHIMLELRCEYCERYVQFYGQQPQKIENIEKKNPTSDSNGHGH